MLVGPLPVAFMTLRKHCTCHRPRPSVPRESVTSLLLKILDLWYGTALIITPNCLEASRETATKQGDAKPYNWVQKKYLVSKWTSHRLRWPSNEAITASSILLSKNTQSQSRDSTSSRDGAKIRARPVHRDGYPLRDGTRSFRCRQSIADRIWTPWVGEPAGETLLFAPGFRGVLTNSPFSYSPWLQSLVVVRCCMQRV